MNRKILITLLRSFLLMSCAGFLTPDTEETMSKEAMMMQSAHYPKPGDIPVLNRKVFKAMRVSIREHPYVASVRRFCTHYVTGVLTSRTIVVTVAHPLIGVPVRELNVVLGENYNDHGSFLYTVLMVIIHQRFDQYSLQNDIAMLRLYEPATYKMNTKAIVIVSQQVTLAGKKIFVTGWGRCDNMGTELCLDKTSRYYPGERMDPMLRSVSFVAHWPNYYCDGYKRHDVRLLPGMMCMGVAREEDQTAPCLGTPGAPLVVHARLAGILSWGFGCGYSYDLPLVYSNLSYFLPWVTHNTKVMYYLRQNNVSTLFEATKAAVLSQWLQESRKITPVPAIRTDKDIELLSIDYELMQVKGDIYDVRDYISGGSFREEKAQMYDALRAEFARTQTSTEKTKRPPTTPGSPFLSNESRREAGL